MQLDKLALDAVALAAMSGATYADAPAVAPSHDGCLSNSSGRKLFPQLRKNVVCDVGGHQRDNPGGASAAYFPNQTGRNS